MMTNKENSRKQEENSENLLQKVKNDISELEYKIFTTEFDEVAKAEKLEGLDEIIKLIVLN